VIGLIQRVTHAQVSINKQIITNIGHGIIALIGIEKSDTKQTADKLLHKILRYRIFTDTTGKMNLGLKNVNGDLLLIPQFTLPADTKKGLRPSFSNSAPPDLGRELFDYLACEAKACHNNVETGSFAADMQVSLTNYGPATFWLQV
jgi:D-tyrosyl-tRNA(Tyr) deacylase